MAVGDGGLRTARRLDLRPRRRSVDPSARALVRRRASCPLGMDGSFRLVVDRRERVAARARA